MKPIVRQLGKRIMHEGAFRHGAISRTSEYLGVSRTTIVNWFRPNRHGEQFTPSKATLARISEMLLRANLDLSARKSGPKGPRTQALAHNRFIVAK